MSVVCSQLVIIRSLGHVSNWWDLGQSRSLPDGVLSFYPVVILRGDNLAPKVFLNSGMYFILVILIWISLSVQILFESTYQKRHPYWVWVSQLSCVSHTEVDCSYGRGNRMGLLIDTFCWLKNPLYHILIAVWWLHYANGSRKCDV